MPRPAARFPLICLTLALAPAALPVAQETADEVDVWVDFERGDMHGVAPMHEQLPLDYIETEVGGVPCVATEGESNRHWLCFDVPRSFVSNARGGRYTLVIRYLDDVAGGLITVRYHGDKDPLAQAIRMQRQGSGEWRELVLNLPDAVFLNGAMGVADFAVYGFTDTGDPREADVFVSGVWLSRRAIDLHVEPAAIPLGAPAEQQVCRVRAVALDGTGGVAPDGTVITFSAGRGTIDAEATTSRGVAEATYRSDGVFGTVVVSAGWDFVSTWATIAQVQEDEPLVEGMFLVGSLARGEAQPLEQAHAETSFAEIVTDEESGERNLVLHYAFAAGAPGQPHITCPLNVPVPGRPRELVLETKGNPAGHHFQLILQDAQGTQYTVMPRWRRLRPGWRMYTVDVEDYDDCWGPAADGVMDFPISVVAARYVCVEGDREGEVVLRDLWARGLFPPDALPPMAPVTESGRSEDGLRVPVRMFSAGHVVDNIQGAADVDELMRIAGPLYGAAEGRNMEALLAYERMVELGADQPRIRWRLGMLCYKNGRFEKALEQADAVLEQEGPPYREGDWPRLLRAWCLDGLERREEAVAEYQAVAEMVKVAEDDGNIWHREGPVEAIRAWCEYGAAQPVPRWKRAPNAGPEYLEVADKSKWRVSCNRGQERDRFAGDSRAESFWSIGGDQKTGDWFAIDFGDVLLDVGRVVLDDDGGTNTYPWDIPGHMVIEGSVDGKTWEELGRAKGHPVNVVDVTFEPRPLRHIRATLTEETGERKYVEWRIYEAYVYRQIQP